MNNIEKSKSERAGRTKNHFACYAVVTTSESRQTGWGCASETVTIDRATLIIPWRELHCCEHGAYNLSLAVQHLGMTRVHRRASPAVDQSTQEQAGQRWRGDLVSMDGSAPFRHRRQEHCRTAAVSGKDVWTSLPPIIGGVAWFHNQTRRKSW